MIWLSVGPLGSLAGRRSTRTSPKQVLRTAGSWSTATCREPGSGNRSTSAWSQPRTRSAGRPGRARRSCRWWSGHTFARRTDRPRPCAAAATRRRRRRQVPRHDEPQMWPSQARRLPGRPVRRLTGRTRLNHAVVSYVGRTSGFCPVDESADGNPVPAGLAQLALQPGIRVRVVGQREGPGADALGARSPSWIAAATCGLPGEDPGRAVEPVTARAADLGGLQRLVGGADGVPVLHRAGSLHLTAPPGSMYAG